MDTIELIREAYIRVADGMKRIDLENDKGVIVKAYWAGTIIRIDIKEPGRFLVDNTFQHNRGAG